MPEQNRARLSGLCIVAPAARLIDRAPWNRFAPAAHCAGRDPQPRLEHLESRVPTDRRQSLKWIPSSLGRMLPARTRPLRQYEINYASQLLKCPINDVLLSRISTDLEPLRLLHTPVALCCRSVLPLYGCHFKWRPVRIFNGSDSQRAGS